MLLQKKTTPLIVDFFFRSGKIDIVINRMHINERNILHKDIQKITGNCSIINWIVKFAMSIINKR